MASAAKDLEHRRDVTNVGTSRRSMLCLRERLTVTLSQNGDHAGVVRKWPRLPRTGC